MHWFEFVQIEKNTQAKKDAKKQWPLADSKNSLTVCRAICDVYWNERDWPVCWKLNTKFSSPFEKIQNLFRNHSKPLLFSKSRSGWSLYASDSGVFFTVQPLVWKCHQLHSKSSNRIHQILIVSNSNHWISTVYGAGRVWPLAIGI